MKTLVNSNLKAKAVAILMLLVVAFTMAAPMLQNAPLLLSPVSTADAASIDDIVIDANGKVDVGTTNGKTDFTAILNQYKTLISVFIGFCTLTCAFFLIKAITLFAGSGDNDTKRKQAISNILTTAIGTGLLGSVWLWFSFFFHVVKP